MLIVLRRALLWSYKNLTIAVGSDCDINPCILPLSGPDWYFNNSYTCLKACVGLFSASSDPPPVLVFT